MKTKRKYVVSIIILFLCCFIFTSCFSNNINMEPNTMDTSSIETSDINIPSVENVLILYPNNLDQIKRDDMITKSSRNSLYTSLAKNEAEGMQFVIRCDSDDLTENSIQVSDLNSRDNTNIIKASTVSVYRQHYINITEPSVVSLPVGYYPDALIPVSKENALYTIKKGYNQAYWFVLKTNSDTPAGIYNGEIIITFDSGVLNVPFTVEVWDFEIPKNNTYKSSYAIWTNMLSGYYGSVDDSLYEEYYWFQNEYRVEPTYLPILDTSDVHKYVDEAERFIKDERVSSFDIPFYYHINDDGSIDLMKEKNSEMVNLLRERGLIDKGYYYIGGLIDEPRPELFDRVKAICTLLKEIAPDVLHVVTTRPKEALSGYVDTWCPLYSEYNEKVGAQYSVKGDGIWWYGCVIPKSPYPNFHIDSNLLCKRLVAWMQKDYNIEGSLYWSTNIFQKYDLEKGSYVDRDIWSDPMAFPGAAGDGFLIYPGKVGDGVVNQNIPVPTIRLEAIRDGVEDQEYLVLLEKKVTGLISKLNLTGQVTKDDVMQIFYSQLYTAADQYDNDTERLLKMRSLIAGYIINDLNHLVVLTDSDNSGSICKNKIKIYAQAGSIVSVNDKLLENPEVIGKASVYTASLDSEFGESSFKVKCNDTECEYMLYCQKPVKYDSEISLIDINEKTVDMIKLNSPKIKEVSYTEYNNKPAIKIVFKDSEDYPQIKIPSTVFNVKDWSSYNNIALEIACPETNQTILNLFVIFSNGSISSDEGLINNLFSGEEKNVLIDFNVYKRLEQNFSDIKSISISSWGDLLRNDGSDGNTTVYITGIKLINK